MTECPSAQACRAERGQAWLRPALDRYRWAAGRKGLARALYGFTAASSIPMNSFNAGPLSIHRTTATRSLSQSM